MQRHGSQWPVLHASLVTTFLACTAPGCHGDHRAAARDIAATAPSLNSHVVTAGAPAPPVLLAEDDPAEDQSPPGESPYPSQDVVSDAPVPVSGLSGIATAVTTGKEHSCALLSSGKVECWGGNERGQLGNGSRVGSATPVPVTGVKNAVAVSAGGSHTCALLQNGTVVCWGDNQHGELGMSPSADGGASQP
jgi:hypothetical protein